MNIHFETNKQETSSSNHAHDALPKIAVRLYENQKLGKSFGPAKFHSAVYNATADIVIPHQKYLLDYVTLQNWLKSARDNDQRDACDHVLEVIEKQGLKKEDILASWVKRYDQLNSKIVVPGFSTFDLSNSVLDVCIADEDLCIESYWKLEVRLCRIKYGQKSPQLLASNHELDHA